MNEEMSAKIRTFFICIQEANHVTKKILQNQTKMIPKIETNDKQRKKNRLTDKETEYRSYSR